MSVNPRSLQEQDWKRLTHMYSVSERIRSRDGLASALHCVTRPVGRLRNRCKEAVASRPIPLASKAAGPHSQLSAPCSYLEVVRPKVAAKAG